MPHQLHPVLDHRRTRVGIVVVELGEVAPDRELARIDRIDRARRAQLAVGIAPEPLRMLLDQQRILGGVVDHQVHHHGELAPRRGLGEAAQQPLGVAAVGEQRVQAIEVLDRVQAAREARVVERVDVEPVEAHGRDPVEMTLPGGHRPGEQRKEVVDPGSGHRQTLPRAAAASATLRGHSVPGSTRSSLPVEKASANPPAGLPAEPSLAGKDVLWAQRSLGALPACSTGRTWFETTACRIRFRSHADDRWAVTGSSRR